MQCNEVIHELAVPSEDRDVAALTEHLAACAACSEWNKRALQLDCLWKTVRPPDPTPQAWDNVWAHIVESLDSPSSTQIEHRVNFAASRNGSARQVAPFVAPPSPASRRRPRSFAALAWFGLAQAAAVLLAVGLVWHSFSSPKSVQIANQLTSSANSTHVDADVPSIEIEEGNLVVIRSEGLKPEVLVLTSESSPLVIDDWLLMLNFAESMAPNPVVAMKE